MTIKHLFPPAWPSLNLDFANSKALDPRITFTRSSIGTYVDADGIVRTAAEDEPRFDHDGGTGESLGLLIEESRTNSVTTSGDVKTAAASTQTGTSSYVTGIAPDGSSSTTLTNWVPDSGATGNSLYGIVSPGTPAAASVFIKANGWNYAGLWFNKIDGSLSGKIFIDLTPGEVLADDNMSSITVVKCANGWWRVGGSSSTNALGTLSIRCCSSSGSSVTPAMNGTDGILLWGLQTEAGTFVTSLIPTAGSPATRSADVCDITGTNFSSWYNQTEGAYLIEAIGPVTQNNYHLSSFRTNSGNKGMDFRVTGDGDVKLHAINGSNIGIQDDVMYGCNIQDGVKAAFSYGVGVYFARGSNSTNTPNLLANQANRIPILDMGSLQFSYSNYTYHLKRAAYYPIRLTDEQLQALTA